VFLGWLQEMCAREKLGFMVTVFCSCWIAPSCRPDRWSSQPWSVLRMNENGDRSWLRARPHGPGSVPFAGDVAWLE